MPGMVGPRMSHGKETPGHEPFVSLGEAAEGLTELADLDQGSTQGFPVQGYAVAAAWANGRPVRGTGLGRQRG